MAMSQGFGPLTAIALATVLVGACSGDAAHGASSGAGASSSGTSSSGGGVPGTSGASGTGGMGSGGSVPGPPPILPVPTADQLAWQRQELSAFFHFGINTFTNQEVGDGTSSPTLFNPTALDATQWMSTIKNAGFREAILVAKHHDGFCLWPTKYTSYSVKSSPWKGGNGDVIKEATDAAHAANLKVGIYLSPWDRHEPSYGTPAYNTYFENLLTELLTNYGPIEEVWFDGANNGQGPQQVYDWAGYYAVVRKLQPHALIAITGPDIRWSGTETGIAPPGETSVQTVNGSLAWYPAESDVSIRPGWFYHATEDTQLKTLVELLDIFSGSVGRNSVSLLNVPPNTQGILAPGDVARVGELGSALSSMLGVDLAAGRAATADSVWQNAGNFGAANAVDGQMTTYWAAASGKTSGRLEVDLGSPQAFNLVSVREPIELGERSTQFHIEAQESGVWSTIGVGTVIGERSLVNLSATTAQKIALVIDQARALPAISEFGVYQSPYGAISGGFATAGWAIMTSSAAQSYVSVANLSIPAGFTIEAWVNATGAGEQAIVAKEKAGSNPNQFRLAIDALSRVYFMMSGATVIGDLFGTDYALTAPITSGVWTHVAITKSGSSFVLYVNGVSKATHTTNAPLDYAGTVLFQLAASLASDGVSPTKVLDGTIDEVRVWNTALSAATLSSYMAKTITAAHPQYGHLVAYYKLDEGSGKVAGDSSQAGTHPGALVNNPTWVKSTAPTGM
jgi:alpha-L-fucosidase